jgi:hypothetical protein
MADPNTPELQVEMQRLQAMADQLRQALDILKAQIDAASANLPAEQPGASEGATKPQEPPQ